MKKIIPVVLIIAGLAIILPSYLTNHEPAILEIPGDLQGIVIDSPATILPKFKLIDHNQQPFDNNNLKGHWSMVFFGYTNCPDVCPTTMRVMNQISQLPLTPKDTQYVFISIDPKRDTPEQLKKFVTYFNPDFTGVSGDKSEIDKFKDSLGVVYDFEGDVNSEDYIVNHFAAIYLIDPDGNERAYVLPPHSEDQVSRAYQLIRSHYE